MQAVTTLFRWFTSRVLPKWPYPIVRGPLRGYRFILGAAAGAGGGVSVHLGRTEIEQTGIVTQLLRPGHVFFDVGANVGYYSLLASKCIGLDGIVVAIEPVPRNISFLHNHVHLNRLSNVLILPFACSDHISLERFADGANHALGHLADAAHDASERASRRQGQLTVAVTVDAIVDRLGMAPDLVKIDVEGAELRVLEGASRTIDHAKPRVLLSTHSDELRASCLDFIARRGYSARPLNDRRVEIATEFLLEP